MIDPKTPHVCADCREAVLREGLGLKSSWGKSRKIDCGFVS
jgi:hypothetical protein